MVVIIKYMIEKNDIGLLFYCIYDICLYGNKMIIF